MRAEIVMGNERYTADELPPNAVGHAKEQFVKYLGASMADSYVDEDMQSLKTAVESIGATLRRWEIDGIGGPSSISVDTSTVFDYDDAAAELAATGELEIPVAHDDGCIVGYGFAEDWNTLCVPEIRKLAAESTESVGTPEGREWFSNALYELVTKLVSKIIHAAKESVEGEYVAYLTPNEETFLEGSAANDVIYDEDGDIVSIAGNEVAHRVSMD